MQPEYWNLSAKIKAREENVRLYRELTGNEKLPVCKGYWTLCNFQPNEKGSEIVQLEDLGLITKNQFFGVDWSEEIILKNAKWHPEAFWYCGEWLDIIREVDNFDPGLVYLDVTKFADRDQIVKMVASTMYLCKKDTVLLVNAMLNDSRSSIQFDPYQFARKLPNNVGSIELEKWISKIPNYTYNCSGKTNMITWAMHKVKV